MIDLMLNIENQFSNLSSENSIDTFFNEFVSNAYLNYLQGNEDDEALEEEFETKVQALYSDLFKDVDNRKAILLKLEDEISSLRSKLEGMENLDEKKNDLLEDLNSLISSQKQLENKKSKYLNIIDRKSVV